MFSSEQGFSLQSEVSDPHEDNIRHEREVMRMITAKVYGLRIGTDNIAAVHRIYQVRNIAIIM